MKQLLQAFTQPPPEQDANANPDQTLDQLVAVLTHPDMERQIKLLVARQLNEMEQSGKGLDVLGGTVILGERNKAARRCWAILSPRANRKSRSSTCAATCRISPSTCVRWDSRRFRANGTPPGT